MKVISSLLCLLLLVGACGNNNKNVPTIGFLDYVEDATLAQARQGFTDALKTGGYSKEQGTVKILYRNAQGDQPTLIQACDYFISEKVDMIAANTTLATITAIQKTKEIPVCMMVAPRPDIAGLTDASGKAPANLFGVYETLSYIDTSVTLIRYVIPDAKRIGTIYNQAEPQSVDAQKRLAELCAKLGLELVSLPVNNSSESQLVTQALLGKKVDAFFALPDNVIFASFEVITKECNDAGVPIFTSEAGLVKRGAVAAFGADMYQWGYQSGMQAARFLKEKNLANIKPEQVKVRKRVYNAEVAKRFSITFDSSFEILR